MEWKGISVTVFSSQSMKINRIFKTKLALEKLPLKDFSIFNNFKALLYHKYKFKAK